MSPDISHHTQFKGVFLIYELTDISLLRLRIHVKSFQLKHSMSQCFIHTKTAAMMQNASHFHS